MGWPARLTDRQLASWHAWFRLWYEGDKPDLSMDGCVPPAVQRRWEGKVAGAAAAVAKGTERRARAVREAGRTGRPVDEVAAELLDREK